MRVCTGFHHSCKGRPIPNQAAKQTVLVIFPIKERRDFLHDRLSSDIWLRCRKKLMTNITFQNGRKARNTWLTGANATLLVYANKKIEDLDNRRKTLSKAIADLSIETLSSQQIELLSGYLDDWEHISFEDKRKAADSLISSISATSNYVKIEWKI